MDGGGYAGINLHSKTRLWAAGGLTAGIAAV